MKQKIDEFIQELAEYHDENVFNPWGDYDPDYDCGPEAPGLRRENLKAYLQPRLGKSPYVVVAEAVGYQGGRFSGIAITCERMLMNLHKNVRADQIVRAGETYTVRTSNPDGVGTMKDIQRHKGFNEPTDTVVWSALVENHVDPFTTLLWNIFPFHPHKPGVPMSNRTPTKDELDKGWPFTKRLLELNGECCLLAVGQKAADTLAVYGREAIALRHPANGGAEKYRKGFAIAVAQKLR